MKPEHIIIFKKKKDSKNKRDEKSNFMWYNK